MQSDTFFRNNESDLLVRFPVALRPSQSSQDHLATHSSLLAERIEQREREDETRTLENLPRLQWKKIAHKVVCCQETAVWKMVMLISIVFNYVQVSYSYYFLRDLEGTTTYYTIIICDIIYALDFVLAVIFYCWKEAQIYSNTSPKSKYFLMFDGLLVSPYSFIYELFFGEVITTVSIGLRSISFLRLSHLVRFFRNKSNCAGENHWHVFLIAYFTAFSVMLHTLTCVFYITACPMDCKTPGGWAGMIEYTQMEKPTSPEQWYLICMYVVLYNVTTVGFGEFIPTNTLERLLFIVSMCLGFICTMGVFIGKFSSHFVNSGMRKFTMSTQLQEIDNHLVSIGMSRKHVQYIMDYYEVLWKKKSGIHEAIDMDLLPRPLQMEICFDINFCLLNCSILFQNKPEPFRRAVSVRMKHEFFQPGGIIYDQYSVKTKMICVVSGVVTILSDEDNESPIISFEAGTCMGESALILNVPVKATLKAVCYTELQVLYKQDFLRIVEHYPEIYSEMYTEIYERVQLAKTRIANASYNQKTHLSLYFPQRHQHSALRQLKLRLHPETAYTYDSTDTFARNCLPLYRYTSNLPEQTNQLCLSDTIPWIIRPNSSLTFAWETIIFVNTLLIGTLYPYYIAFENDFPLWLDHLGYFLDAINLLDIYVILTTAIQHKNHLIVAPKQIVSARLSSISFYFDFMASIYTEIFSLFLGYDRWYYVFRLNRMLKMYRLVTYFDVLESDLKANLTLIRLIKYPMFLMLCPYWFGSLMYLQTCFYPLCDETGWYYAKVQAAVIDRLVQPCTTHIVALSLYLAVSCMSAIGYGDVSPANFRDLILMCAGIIIGIFLFGYCTAQLSCTFSLLLKQKIQFQQQFFAMQKFLDRNVHADTLKERITNFFIFQWYHSKGQGLISMESLYFNAPQTIQQNVVVHERIQSIRGSPLFRNLDDHFLELIASNCRILVLPPGEIVSSFRRISREMYIIQMGYCSETIEGKQRILGPTSEFGIVSLLYREPSVSTIVTITHCQLICIDHLTFSKSISMYPSIGREIYEQGDLTLTKQPSHVMRPHESRVFLKQNRTWFGPIWDRITHYWRRSLSIFDGSFVNVRSYCTKHTENYNEPFKQLGKFYFLKYLLPPICIVPDGLFLKIWFPLRLFIAFGVSLLTPYQIITAPYNPSLDTLLFYTDIVAYVDLYINLLIGYYGVDHQFITHPLECAKNYLKGPFILDFILCFPWEIVLNLLIFDHTEGHSDFGHKVMPHIFHCQYRYLRIFQVYKLSLLIRYYERDITRKGHLLQIFRFLPISVAAINFFASLFVLTSCSYWHRSDIDPAVIVNGFAKPAGYAEQPLQEYALYCLEDSWLDRSNLQNFTQPIEVLAAATYWATTTLVGCGFGDITPQHYQHVLITIVMIIAGILMFGYTYASIASQKINLESKLSEYQDMMYEFHQFMQFENIDKMVQRKYIDYFEFLWKRTNGMEVISNLHNALLEDTLLEMYEKTLREVPLLENVEKSFYRALSKELCELSFKNGQIILKNEDVIGKIFILHRGKVEVLSANKQTQTYMGVGALFGNILPQRKTKCHITVTATRNLDLLSVKTHIFYAILKDYPHIRKRLEDIIKQGYEYIMPSVWPEDSNVDMSSKSDASAMHDSYLFDEPIAASIASTAVTNISRFATFTAFFLPHKWFRIAVMPDASLLVVWTHVTFIATYINIILVVYQFAFQQFNIELLVLSLVIDWIFLVKMFLDMHKAHLNQYGEYVTDNKKICRMYMQQKTDRIIDFLANLPVYYVVFIIPGLPKPKLYFTSLHLITLLRCVYLIDFYKTVTNRLMVNSLLLKIVSMSLAVIVILHLYVCLLYIITCPLGYCVKGAWITHFSEAGDYANLDSYILYYYYISSILTTTGIGDVSPYLLYEIIFVIISMISTKFLVGLFIGYITSILNTFNKAMVNYDQGIAELRDYLLNENVSDHQMDKMWKYVTQLWRRSHGRQMPRLLNQLPYVMHCEFMDCLYGDILRNSYIFAACEQPFIRQLSVLLNHTVFFPGNYIVQHGDSDQAMYFIQRGAVEVLTVHANLTETIHEVLHNGEMFGIAQGLFYGVPHHFSFRARTTVDILSLELSRWQALLRFYPQTKTIIYQKAESVYVQV